MPRSEARSTARHAASARVPYLETALPASSLRYGPPAAEPSDLVVVAIAEGARLSADAAAIDSALGGLLRTIIANGDFRGETLKSTLLYLGPGAPARRALVVGLGKPGSITLETIRRAAGLAARRARELGAGRVEMTLLGREEAAGGVGGGAGSRDAAANDAPSIAEIARAVAEGFLLGAYRFAGLRSEARARDAKPLVSVTLVAPRGAPRARLEAALVRARAAAAGVFLARDLAHLPPNRLTPSVLADEARRLGRSPRVGVAILDETAIEKAGMGALLAVARGSVEPPRFIVLESKSGKKNAPRLALIGKGVTFDSGGLSLKPAQRMEEMKYDMCGAAAVLGVFRAVAETGAPIDLIGAIPATENLPSGHSVRPGDVVVSHSGKTIEVLNTDAEGRLVLADALSYVERTYRPDAILDLATLTGAIGIALGQHAAGLFSDDEAFAERIERAGRSTGERAWRLPLWDDYFDHIKSEIADVKNIANGSAGAGAVIGAVFLRRFVEKTPWAHLDIAAVAWSDKDRHYAPRGPSGYGVRLLLELIENWSARRPVSPSPGRRR